MASKVPWKQQKEAYLESLYYLKGRQDGSITSLVTPWSQVNNATTNGLEWHSMTVIGGRPAFKLNTTDNFRVLEFSLEMLGKNSAIRAYSSELGVTYKYLCSADGTLTDTDLARCHEYAKKAIVYPIDIVEEAPTIEEFVKIITLYMEQHAIMKDGKKTYQNTVVTVDHSLLLKPIAKQNRNDMLYDLGEAITSLKRKYPIIFIILSQLNRSIDHPERNEDGKYGNYVLESDIFGADALLQHADTVIGLNRPGKQKIRFYGPERYIVPDDRLLVMHFLKCRNGENGLAFFHAAFERMTIDEAPVPPQQEMRRGGM
jgi:replicative DNA helicase